MNFVVKTLNVILSVIALNVVLPIEAQLFGGTSVVLGKKHYYIETANQGNFYEAAQNCAQMGMTLASIDTDSDESKRIIGFLTTNEILDKEYWLSGIKVGSTSYIWLGTGKPLKPALTVTDDCVATTAAFANEAQDCTVSHYYICEKPLEPYCGKYGQCRYTYSTNSN